MLRSNNNVLCQGWCCCCLSPQLPARNSFATRFWWILLMVCDVCFENFDRNWHVLYVSWYFVAVSRRCQCNYSPDLWAVAKSYHVMLFLCLMFISKLAAFQVGLFPLDWGTICHSTKHHGPATWLAHTHHQNQFQFPRQASIQMESAFQITTWIAAWLVCCFPVFGCVVCLFVVFLMCVFMCCIQQVLVLKCLNEQKMGAAQKERIQPSQTTE